MKFFQIILFVCLFIINTTVFANSTKTSTLSTHAVASESEGHATLLNINTATKKELMTIIGLNPSKARAIVAWRKKNGPFTTLDTLRQVSGFKRMDEKNFKSIQEKLSLS